MITFDGNRSLNRKWFAKKQIQVIKDLDVPSKSVKWEGFTFTAWQQGDLDGGRVTAPMGAVVMCSSSAGIKIAASDFWAGACTSYGDFYRLKPLDTENFHYAIMSGLVSEAQWATEPFVPALNSALYLVGTEDISVQNYPCCPSVNPYLMAEGVQVIVSDVVDDGARLVFFCSDVLRYNSNNNGLSRISFYRTFYDTLSPSRFYPRFVCQNRPNGNTTTFLGHMDGNYWVELDGDAPGGVALVAATTTETKVVEEVVDGKITRKLTFIESDIYVRDLYPPGCMPDFVRNTMITELFSEFILGCYSFTSSLGELVFIRCSLFGSSTLNSYISDGNPNNFYMDNLENQQWIFMLSITVGDQVYVYNWHQFKELLESRATQTFLTSVSPLHSDTSSWDSYTSDPIEAVHVHVDNVASMIQYFFPYPNATGQFGSGGVNYFAAVPHDSVMFHSEDDEVFTWTRDAGSIKINRYGMFSADIQVPPEVTNNPGARPDISHAGNGVYFCACNKVKDSILATYYGTPFAGGLWNRLVDPLEGTLVHVRPVVVSEDQIFLIGVVKTTNKDGLEVYRFASFRQKGFSAEGTWALFMQVPFEVGESDNFAVGLYGNDSMVQALLEYPSPPPAMPQTLVGPYENYAEWRP